MLRGRLFVATFDIVLLTGVGRSAIVNIWRVVVCCCCLVVVCCVSVYGSCFLVASAVFSVFLSLHLVGFVVIAGAVVAPTAIVIAVTCI